MVKHVLGICLLSLCFWFQPVGSQEGYAYVTSNDLEAFSVTFPRKPCFSEVEYGWSEVFIDTAELYYGLVFLSSERSMEGLFIDNEGLFWTAEPQRVHKSAVRIDFDTITPKEVVRLLQVVLESIDDVQVRRDFKGEVGILEMIAPEMLFDPNITTFVVTKNNVYIFETRSVSPEEHRAFVDSFTIIPYEDAHKRYLFSIKDQLHQK